MGVLEGSLYKAVQERGDCDKKSRNVNLKIRVFLLLIIFQILMNVQPPLTIAVPRLYAKIQ